MQTVILIVITFNKNNELCNELNGNTRKKRQTAELNSAIQYISSGMIDGYLSSRRKRQAENTEGTAIVTSDESILNLPTALIIFQNVDR